MPYISSDVCIVIFGGLLFLCNGWWFSRPFRYYWFSHLDVRECFHILDVRMVFFLKNFNIHLEVADLNDGTELNLGRSILLCTP